jgi:hypothetical protein
MKKERKKEEEGEEFKSFAHLELHWTVVMH